MRTKITIYQLLLLFFSLSILSSCSKKEVNCSDADGQKVFYDLLSENFENVYNEYKKNKNEDFNFNLPFQEVKNDFFDNAIKMIGIRPTEVDKELKKCTCQTIIKFQIPNKITSYIEDKVDWFEIDMETLTETEKIEDIDYSYQITEDNKIYCETPDENKLDRAFYNYAYYRNWKNNMEKEDIAQEKAQLNSTDIFKFVDFQFGDNPHYLFEDSNGKEYDFLGVEDSPYEFYGEDNTGYFSNPRYRGKKFKINYKTEKLAEYPGSDDIVDHYIVTDIKLIRWETDL